MSSTLNVQDRRRAALERLGHEVPAPKQRRARLRSGSTSVPRSVRGARAEKIEPTARSRRSRLRPVGRPREESSRREKVVTDPPSLVWYGIIAVVAAFVLLGLIMVLSASAVTEANRGNSPYNLFRRQAMWAGFGTVGLIVAARMPYTWWRRTVIPLGALSIAAMLAPFAPGSGGPINGAHAWVRVGGLSVQPSEFVKLAMVILVADLLTRQRHVLNQRHGTLFPLAVIGGAGAGLCIVQGDLGSAIVMGAIAFAIAWIAGVPFRPLAAMGTIATLAGLAFVAASPMRVDRFTAFLDVDGNKDHLAWQTYQGYVGMASSGIGGSGIGGSKAKLGYLPYAHSDFIFAIIADELGLIGAAAVVVGFALLVLFGVQTALAAPDRFGMLVAGGVASWFGVQAIVNLGGVTGLMPVTGLTLPFFSVGGSSLFVSMVAVGLLLSVTRRIGSRTEARS